ncbi:MAG: hypothetical protein AAB090_07635 [Nitrospirota bacterium]
MEIASEKFDLIPGIGTSLVLAPAIIFLFLSGGTFSAIGLLVWGVGAVVTFSDYQVYNLVNFRRS